MSANAVTDLAAELDQMFRWHLSADQYRAAVDANRAESNPYVCHTHDYIDANVSAAIAFANVTGRELDPANDTDTALINAAWDLWKQQTTAEDK